MQRDNIYIDVWGSDRMERKAPKGYDQKFKDFIRLCKKAKAQGVNSIIIGFPWVIGDDYDEIIESLSLLSDAGLSLHIAGRWDTEHGGA